MRRPHLVRVVDCRNVLIEGVTLRNSPMWTISPLACDNVTITKLTVINPPDSPNTDGINPDSCRNVHISDCHVDVGDDCITIKSGKEDDGRRELRACENITVTNCTLMAGHGGVVIGSEISGSIRNVTISNCVFVGTDRGIRIKARRGRGGVGRRHPRVESRHGWRHLSDRRESLLRLRRLGRKESDRQIRPAG